MKYKRQCHDNVLIGNPLNILTFSIDSSPPWMILKKIIGNWFDYRNKKQKKKNAVIVNDHLGHIFFTSRLKADVPSTVVQIQVVQH